MLAKLFLILLGALGSVAYAQATPDCAFTLTFTGTGAGTGFNNQVQSKGCVGWRVTVTTSGFTTVSVALQTSPDNVTYTSVTSQACSDAVNNLNCQTDGVNPVVGKSATAASRAFSAFMRVNVTAVTGSGSGLVTALGYRGTSIARNSGGSAAPTGAAGGDLGGTYPNPTVLHLANVTDSSLANSGLANPSTTVNGTVCTLGASCSPPTAPTATTIAQGIYCLNSASSANAITCATATAFGAYPAGGFFTIRWGGTGNTAGATANMNALGVRNITIDGVTAVVGGNLVANQFYTLEYDDGDGVFILVNPTPVLGARRTVCSTIGANNGAALVDADLGPQSRQYFIPSPMTLIEMDVAADGGTPNVILGRSRAGVVVNLTSSALATAAAGGIACSNTGGTLGLDAVTTCTNTLQNTSFSTGDWYTLVSGTAGGVAKEFTACLVFVLTAPPR